MSGNAPSMAIAHRDTSRRGELASDIVGVFSLLVLMVLVAGVVSWLL